MIIELDTRQMMLAVETWVNHTLNSAPGEKKAVTLVEPVVGGATNKFRIHIGKIQNHNPVKEVPLLTGIQ